MHAFARDAIIGDLLGLVERFASPTLSGPGGIGKSTIALTLLHHDRTTARFGKHRHFMRCDDLVNSLGGFLGRLSDAFGMRHTTDVVRLRSRLALSPPCILVLDGVDSILDPLAPGAAEIATMIEEINRSQDVCLLTTSRMEVDIPGLHRIEVPTLSEGGARDTFHSLCHLERSSAIDKLLAELDFHPLSIDLLASAVGENDWDEPTLLEEWDGGKTSILKASGRQSLEDSIEAMFLTPTIQKLGATAREALEAIALYSGGVEENRLESRFPGIAGVGEAANVLCKFSLMYRQGGFVNMLSPFRFYFLESTQALVFRLGSDTDHSPPADGAAGNDTIHNSPVDETPPSTCHLAEAGASSSLSLF